jgi:hypothetical protein
MCLCMVQVVYVFSECGLTYLFPSVIVDASGIRGY